MVLLHVYSVLVQEKVQHNYRDREEELKTLMCICMHKCNWLPTAWGNMNYYENNSIYTHHHMYDRLQWYWADQDTYYMYIL